LAALIAGLKNRRKSLKTVAAHEGKTVRLIRMALSLGFVAHAIVAAPIEGRLPGGFGVKRPMDRPMIRSQQWIALGLTPLA
jgi:hypothetical protein